MLRNIERLRGQGIMVSGAWFNKDVLMLNETIKSQAHSPTSGDRSGLAGDDDSIFNIELYNLGKVKNVKDLQNDYQH